MKDLTLETFETDTPRLNALLKEGPILISSLNQVFRFMKRTLLFVTLLAVANSLRLFAQPSLPNNAVSKAVPDDTPYDQSAERGPHHRLRSVVQPITNELGIVSLKTNRYTELQPGMHYWEDNQWKESREEIEIFKDGAVARKGGHKVVFSSNINAEGAIDLLSPDGKRFRSRVLGLSYYDAASGNSVLIAEIKDSIGQLVAPNQIVYPDAFTDLKADLRYTWTLGGFEQDVILLEIPPAPENFGLASTTTRLQVWTEFFNPPQPQKAVQILKQERDPLKRLRMAAPDFIDETLAFGAMSVGPGEAFALNGERPRTTGNPQSSERVAKRWMKVEGRDFLIEEVEFPAMADRIRTLLRQGAKMEDPKRPATTRKGVSSDYWIASHFLAGTPHTATPWPRSVNRH